MTEAEWPAATNPTRMWWLVDGKVSERKFRLLGCAYCRHVRDKLIDGRCGALGLKNIGT